MVATKQMTVEEFEVMPREGNWELVDGELVEMSPAADESATIGATIIGLLWPYVRANRLGRVYNAEGGFVIFADRATVRAPDVAFVRADRAPQGASRKHFPRLAPDLAVEVLSPSDRMADALSKIAMYLEAGVRVVWLVDPAERTVTIFQPDHSPKTLGGDDALDGGDVLPGLTMPLAEIFQD
jgi:Uma2 family endonuclease